MITLLRGECYSSHLLFTCFLALSLTLSFFCSLRFGVFIKRRRCDHSPVRCLSKTTSSALKIDSYSNFYHQRSLSFLSSLSTDIHNLSKPFSCTDHFLIKMHERIVGKSCEQQETQNFRNVASFLQLVLMYMWVPLNLRLLLKTLWHTLASAAIPALNWSNQTDLAVENCKDWLLHCVRSHTSISTGSYRCRVRPPVLMIDCMLSISVCSSVSGL